MDNSYKTNFCQYICSDIKHKMLFIHGMDSMLEKIVFLSLMCFRELPTRNALIMSFVVLSFFGACLDALGLINPVGIKRL